MRGGLPGVCGRVVNAEIVSLSALAIEYNQHDFTIPFGRPRCARHLRKPHVVLGAGCGERFHGQGVLLLVLGASLSQMLINIDMSVAHRRHSLRECVVWDGIVSHFRSPIRAATLRQDRLGAPDCSGSRGDVPEPLEVSSCLARQVRGIRFMNKESSYLSLAHHGRRCSSTSKSTCVVHTTSPTTPRRDIDEWTNKQHADVTRVASTTSPAAAAATPTAEPTGSPRHRRM